MSFCSNCGNKIAEGVKFCGGCGSAVVQAKSEAPKQVNNEHKFGDLPSYSQKAKKEVEAAEAEPAARGYGYASGVQVTTDTQWLPKEVDYSDAELKTAWKRVNTDKDSANWLLFAFDGDAKKKSNSLHVAAVGEGGYKELYTKLTKSNGSVFFGILLVIGVNKGDSVQARRNKFVYFDFVGAGVPELVGAQVGSLKRKIEQFFGSTQLALELQGAKLSTDFTPNSISWRIHHASGSHKCDQYDLAMERLFKPPH